MWARFYITGISLRKSKINEATTKRSITIIHLWTENWIRDFRHNAEIKTKKEEFENILGLCDTNLEEGKCES